MPAKGNIQRPTPRMRSVLCGSEPSSLQRRKPNYTTLVVNPADRLKRGRKRPLSAAAERMKKKRLKGPTESSSEPVIVSSGEEDNGQNQEHTTWQKIHGITLTQEERDIILNGEWLTDSIVHAAQLLMKHDNDLLPVGSLQNTILGETLAFEVAGEESVQILHSGGNHWITISTVGMKHPTVRVYDSLYSTLPASTKEQIAALLHTEESAITLEYANIQKQRNASDCGVRQWQFAMGSNQNNRHFTFERCGVILLIACRNNSCGTFLLTLACVAILPAKSRR